MDCHPKLLSTAMTTGTLYWTAVASSCIVIMKSPSPTTPTTWRSGAASFAPMAAGRVKPIVEKPAEVTLLRGS